jgi:hypothetical protein
MGKLLLLTIEGAVSLSAQEILITPFVPPEYKPKQIETSVILKLPDGRQQVVDAIFGGPSYGINEIYVCILKGINKEDIVAGTEVWVYE